MTVKRQSAPILEQSLLSAMCAIDNQISREMQRTPEQLDRLGVQKWEPLSKRVELVCAFILESLGHNRIELDSILVLAHAYTRALQLVIEDLGPSGLGQVRSSYCLAILAQIEHAVRTTRNTLDPKGNSEVT